MSSNVLSSGDHQPRRSFLTKVSAFAVGSVIGLVPLVSGIVMLFDPLIKKRKSVLGADDEGFLKVSSESSLASDGTPRLFPVIADLQDAWNKFPRTEIGSVYLRRTDAGEIECLAARCPHLACTVDYKPDQKVYACPCHASSFGIDGARNNEIPPRGMDRLPVEVRDGDIWVKFQTFRTGIPEQVPV
jgi:nitrite reductase/ring-hydroxylating ferredoxin subunit